jgi:CHAT domain-containing protein
LWTTQGGIFNSKKVPVGRQQLGETVLKFRQLLETPSSNLATLQDTSKQLYDWLIEPLADELDANQIQNLVFALDRVTRYIPMSALFDGENYLVENYTISTILSAKYTDTTASQSTPIEETTVLALGLSDAHPGFNPLPNVPKELDAIVVRDDTDSLGIYPGSEFLNEDFDYQTLRDNLYYHKYLHIATHGEFVPGDAEQSYLLLGTGDKLPIPDIKKLKSLLSDIELVVLSACQTALGGPGQDGNEINGISSYFLQNGARVVAASLWLVNDASTSLLMQNFYTELAQGTEEQPITKAQALRQAQLSLLHNEARATASADERTLVVQPISGASTANSPTPGFSHPYYWAPFILIGNGL